MAAQSASLSAYREREELTRSLLAQAGSAGEPDRTRLHQEVVELNMPLARAIAASYANRGVDIDDLRQVSYLALLKSVQGFDVGRTSSFAAYAVPTIRGEVRRYFRDHGSLIRPPRELQELRLAIASVANELTQQLRRQLSVTDLSIALGISEDLVRRTQLASVNQRPQSLEAPHPSWGTVGMRIASPEDDLDRLEWALSLRHEVAALDGRSQEILAMRFVEELTQDEIAERLGISQMQVSRLLGKILGRLRGQLTAMVG